MGARRASRLPASFSGCSLRVISRAALRRVLVLACVAVCVSHARTDEITAWGWDTVGEVSGTPTGRGFTAVAAGYNHAFALRANGSIAAWGDNTYGQVSSAPTGTGFSAIASGGDHGYALAADGSITAWGRDLVGQVSNTPTGTGFTAVAGGAHHGYALRADGSIAAWGADHSGQVSNAPTDTGFTAIVSASTTGFALRADGSIAAWGYNGVGLVSSAPTGAGFTALAAFDSAAFALQTDGSIAAWGNDGTGLVSNTPTGTGFTAIACGTNHAYALRADGSIAAWGLESGGGEILDTPVGSGFTAVFSGSYNGFALSPVPAFCDAEDGALDACPCRNPGTPDTGCDNPGGTGGVRLGLLVQQTSPQNRTTAACTGFPGASSPGVIVIRASTLEAGPIPFGDGLRCIGVPVVQLGAALAVNGTSVHTFGHGAMIGSGTFYYQAWYRSQPAMYCTPDAFNMSSGLSLVW